MAQLRKAKIKHRDFFRDETHLQCERLLEGFVNTDQVLKINVYKTTVLN
jgi:hypothetical protein